MFELFILWIEKIKSGKNRKADEKNIIFNLKINTYFKYSFRRESMMSRTSAKSTRSGGGAPQSAKSTKSKIEEEEEEEGEQEQQEEGEGGGDGYEAKK